MESDMGLIDEFITDMTKKEPDPGKKEPGQAGQKGAFDDGYSKAFMEYCNKTPVSQGK